jgi:hypothetical protein
MQITETERLMLVKNKELICGATIQILRLENDSQNSLVIKENIQTILQLVNTIASYSDAKNFNLDRLLEFALFIQNKMNMHILLGKERAKDWSYVVKDLETFCGIVNSIRFDFNHKEGIKITLPKMNLNFGHITNQ